MSAMIWQNYMKGGKGREGSSVGGVQTWKLNYAEKLTGLKIDKKQVEVTTKIQFPTKNPVKKHPTSKS